MSDTQATERDDASAAETTETTQAAATTGAVETGETPATDVEATAGDTTALEAQPSGESADDTDSDDDPQPADDASSAQPVAKGEKGSRVRQLEREGEVAADFLESLLDIADLDGDIDVDVDGDRAAIAIVDSDEGRVPRRLVGTDGKVLEALQELTRLAVQAETGERSRLMLDIAGHRAERRSALVELAQAAIAEVKESGAKRSLEPMSAFERKVVHDEVAAAGLVSESEGVDPNRHIVILPA